VAREIRSFWEILTQQAVRVFIAPALPRAARIAEIDLHFASDLFLRTHSGSVARDYPDIELDNRVIDALCMELVIKPETYDGLLLPNLYATSQ
jgi:isocitrate/isopropylmalate dehydrogenase